MKQTSYTAEQAKKVKSSTIRDGAISMYATLDYLKQQAKIYDITLKPGDIKNARYLPGKK